MAKQTREFRDAAGWTDAHYAVLRTGNDGHCAFIDGKPRTVPARLREGWDESPVVEARLRKAVEDIGEEIMAGYSPFFRPWFWWRFFSPERRRCINGEHYYDRLGRDHVYPSRYSFGIPLFMYSRDDTDCEYEAERGYLIRLNLHTDHERELLTNETQTTAAPAA